MKRTMLSNTNALIIHDVLILPDLAGHVVKCRRKRQSVLSPICIDTVLHFGQTKYRSEVFGISIHQFKKCVLDSKPDSKILKKKYSIF